MLIFSMYIVGVVYNLLYCYLFCKCVLKEKFRISKRILIISCVLAIPLCLNFYYNKTPLKPFVSYFVHFIILKMNYNMPYLKTLMGILISFLIVSISELIFAVVVVNFMGISQNYLNGTIDGFCLTNFSILIIVLFIINISKVKKIINNIVISFEGAKLFYFATLVVLCISLVIFIIYENLSNEFSLTYLIFINLFFISVYVFMIGFFIQKSNNNILANKYDQLIDYSKTYEQELVKRSKKQHEFKNQLVIIKSMVEDNDKSVVNYINDILHDNNRNKDTKWLTRLTNIPLGGLKGLIYYKVNEMTSKGIRVNLDVAESLNKKSLWKTYSDNSQDISKIIGVYIDNAIEAASDSKEKVIEVQFYLENENITLCLGNTFTGEVDLTKIDNEGYSTKGNNRGYGLPLAKDLLTKHSDILLAERTIIDNYYVQKLVIKSK